MKKPQRSKKPQIGFIGQGWVGKNYSDDFEKRGYEVIRYSLEVPYVYNKEKIAECDIVFCRKLCQHCRRKAFLSSYTANSGISSANRAKPRD
jgi:hypothetical protein